MDWWSFIFLSCTESVIQVESFQLPLLNSLSNFAKSLENGITFELKKSGVSTLSKLKPESKLGKQTIFQELVK